MIYNEKVILKNGAELIVRNGTEADGAAVFDVFNQTHAETEFLLSYPDENSFDAVGEAEFLKKKTESEREIEIIALLDGRIVACAGIEAVGSKSKVKHRAVFGISVLKDYWRLGIGDALAEACIKCAKEAGYAQLELDVVADNAGARALYEKHGFVEFGRNPLGFRPRSGEYQELLYMRLEL